MNEIDLKTKIEGLEKAIQEHKADANRYEDQLKDTTQQLKDYNKPELTGSQLDDIQEAIEAGIESFDFSDSGNYNIEYGIDYDGKVHCENLELTDTYELTEAITEKVHRLFKEILDTTEPDHHKVTHVEKII
tara:strand:+ start:599 stop:994 length:396 start_codon:yes stop_codon:yes gene_type:complete